MRITSFLVLTALIAIAGAGWIAPGTASAQAAATEAPFKYVGVTQCKMCHTGETKGKIYEIWLATAHAKAFDNLPADQKTNDKCLGCHTTGHGKALAAGKTAEAMQGVQCEACHGPGSEYKTMSVMKDKAAAMKKGLVVELNEKVCTGCHVAELPKEIEAHAKAPKFDFATFYKKIEHHLPKAPAPAK